MRLWARQRCHRTLRARATSRRSSPSCLAQRAPSTWLSENEAKVPYSAAEMEVPRPAHRPPLGALRRQTSRAGPGHPHRLRAAFITALAAGVPLRDVQVAARHADPRTTTVYDRRRQNFDRHAAYVVVAFVPDSSTTSASAFLISRPPTGTTTNSCRSSGFAHASRRPQPESSTMALTALAARRSSSTKHSNPAGTTWPVSSRRQHAELVAIGVGHDHPRDVSLTDINAFGADRDEPVDLDSLIAIGRGRDVQMQSILRRLGVAAGRPKGDEWTFAVRCADRGVSVLVVNQRPTDRLAPETTGDRISRLEHDRSDEIGRGQEVSTQ